MSRPTKAPPLWPPQQRLRFVELDPARPLRNYQSILLTFDESKTYGRIVAVPRFLRENLGWPPIRKFSNEMNQLVDSLACLLANPQAPPAQAAVLFPQ
ncbi:MAG: hypothetical protein WB760_31830 [Xanthobacteraceae bacterium]